MAMQARKVMDTRGLTIMADPGDLKSEAHLLCH
jgi:hypothetical protein